MAKKKKKNAKSKKGAANQNQNKANAAPKQDAASTLPDTVQLDRQAVMKELMTEKGHPESQNASKGPSQKTQLGPDGGQGASGNATGGGDDGGNGGSFSAHIGAKLLLLAATIFGIVISVRVTLRHLELKYGEAAEDALCTINAQFNCDNVLNSDYAAIGDLPISLPQLANFIVIAIWAILLFVGSARLKKAAASYVFGMGLLSTVVSLFLFFISKTQIGAFCPYCMMLYAANIGVFVAGLWAMDWKFQPALKHLFGALALIPLLVGSAGAWAATVGGSYALYNQSKSQLISEQIARADAKQAEAKKQSASQSQEEQAGKFPRVSESDPYAGKKDAEVVVVEFADFQCGYCKRLSYELKRTKEEYGDQVKFVFKHFPMNTACNPHVKNDRHPYACGAALASECAQEQGKFWEYHDILFKNSHRLRSQDLRHYAEELELDIQAFDQCMRDPAMRKRLREDMDEAARLDIHGTPRTYIAGEEIRGVRPAEFFANRLAKALGENKSRIKRDREAFVAAREAAQKAPESVAVTVDGKSFKIDSFEATIDASGKAVSRVGEVPATRVSWYAAKEACEKAGKRLCTVEEWMSACTGEAPIDNDGDGKYNDDYIEGSEYPYGQSYGNGYCHVDGDPEKSNVRKTGQSALCQTPNHIFDMTGNVAEWVGATEDEAVLIGGGFIHKDKAKCWKIQDTFGPGWAQRYSGFRCCQ